MKKLLFALAAIVSTILFQSCGSHMYSARSGGQADQSYIIVLTDGEKFNNVVVDIDGVEYPIKKVYKTKAAIKARPVITSTGKHSIKVLVDGKIVREEKIFLGVQQTKKITL